MKRAFTLIELIGVLVIIGLVTLVVSVLVTGIIRKAKYEAYKRSIDNYAKVVETAMETYQAEHLRYPESFDELDIEYTGAVIECGVSRINPDYTIYLDKCKVNGNSVDYHYGNLVLTDKEYVDKLGKNIEIALKDYHDEHNKYPINYRLLSLPELDKDVKCASEINSDGTIYLTNCTVDGVKVLANDTEDGYYHYGENITAVKYLLKKTNGIEIDDYTDGDIHEMYTFEHAETEQTPALTDYRYIGNDPYNYVTFNGNETWRMIGIFSVDDGTGKYESRIKLMRNETLGNKSWASNTNEWIGSTMQIYLNDQYVFDDKSINMIASTKWYLASMRNISGNGEDLYVSERGNNVYSSDRSKNWIGSVGLIYPSDYVYTYASGVDDTCFNTMQSCNNGFPNSGWLFPKLSKAWTLSPNSSTTYRVVVIHFTGYLYDFSSTVSTSTYPAVYLKPNVKIISGDGTSSNPYQLSL